LPARGDEDVRRLDVPMSDRLAVGRDQPIRDLNGQIDQRVILAF